MPRVIIVAGPNGAGKTSFANEYLATLSPLPTFVNADEISRRLREEGMAAARADIRAARHILQHIQTLVSARRDIIIETTLSSRGYAGQIPDWRRNGYAVSLVFLRLPNVEASIERVRRRVVAGGHDIPEATLRRRFGRSICNLERLYKPLVDEWYVWRSAEGSFEPAEAWDDHEEHT